MALVMVLASLTILTIMLTEFQDETAADFGSALSMRDSIRAEYAAKSGVNLTRLLIATEPTIRKALAPLFILMKKGPPQIPVWAFADDVLGAFNDSAGGEKFSALAGMKLDEGVNLGMDGAGFDVKVVDEESKINVNLAWRDSITKVRLSAELLGLMKSPQYDLLFENRDADGQYSDRSTICAAIVDWADSDTQAWSCGGQDATVGTSAAAEDSFYQMLKVPYPRKNAPLDSLEELRLVRGFSDTFWSTFVQPDDDDPSTATLTVWGGGKVNVNTTNAQTLAALICGGSCPTARLCTDPAEAIRFFTVVELVKGMTAGAPLFSSPKGFINALEHKGMFGQVLASLGLEPIKMCSPAEAMKAVSTESKVFSIFATGRAKSGRRESRVKVHAVVDFRGAPPPPDMTAAMAQGMASLGGVAGPAAAGAGGAAQSSNLPTGATEDAIAAALQPNPAGKVIYFRIE